MPKPRPGGQLRPANRPEHRIRHDSNSPGDDGQVSGAVLESLVARKASHEKISWNPGNRDARRTCTRCRGHFLSSNRPAAATGRRQNRVNAMSDPFWPGFPKELANQIGPRNLVHSWATDVDDTAVQPRWGTIGKQKIVDEGPLPPHPMPGIKYNMETIDDVILNRSLAFMQQGATGQQTLLRVAQPDVVAHFYPSVAQVPETSRHGQLRTPRSRYGPVRRHRRSGHEEARRDRAPRTIRSSA